MFKLQFDLCQIITEESLKTDLSMYNIVNVNCPLKRFTCYKCDSLYYHNSDVGLLETSVVMEEQLKICIV